MLRRIHRAIAGLTLLVLVGLIIFITIIPRIQHQDIPSSLLSSSSSITNNSRLSTNSGPSFFTPPSTTPDEQFLSYSRHGDYFEQHESLRMAVRLAYETNRTVVAPPLRLVYNNNTRIQFPWSQFFDFKPIEKKFGIRIVDRPLPPPKLYNTVEGQVEEKEKWPAEYYEQVEITQNTRLQQQKSVNKWSSSSFMQWVQSITKTRVPPPSLPGSKYIFSLEELKTLENPYVHCHALSSWMFRKSLDVTDQQTQLNLALTTNMLTGPDKVVPMTNATNAIVQELGGVGKFSGLTIHMDQMVPHGETDNWLFADDNNDDSNESREGEDKKYNATAARLLMKQRRKDAMKDVALELFSSMPINQAVSAALPIQPSPLRDYLEEQKTHDQQQQKEESEQDTSRLSDRRRLLNVCKDYRRHIDAKFPVIYLMVNEESNKNTTAVDSNIMDEQQQQQQQQQEQIEQEKETDDISILEPILEYFPCVFYKKDMYEWGVIDGSWAIESQIYLAEHVEIQENYIDSGDQVASTQVVDYEQLLSPLLDLLVAGQGHSFFEVPPSPLTREVLWQLAGNK